MKTELIHTNNLMQVVFPSLSRQGITEKLKEFIQKADKFITKFPDYTYEYKIIPEPGLEADEQDTYTLIFIVREKTQEELNKDYGTY